MASPQFDRVLVPLEFIPAERGDPDAIEAAGYVIGIPPATEVCLRAGARLAGSTGLVRLVHATPSLSDAALYGGPEGTWIPDQSLAEVDKRARQSAIAVLQTIARTYLPDTRVEVDALAGSPISVILREADAFQPDVIVLATSGRGRARRFFLGSTADKVIREAQCPVLVIPTGSDDAHE